MSTSHKQPEHRDSRTPQVVVRADKYYLCSACGTLVEIPPEVVGQLVLVAGETTEAPTAAETPCVETSPSPKLQAQSPPRPKRPKQPARVSFVGETIDGLRVPSAKQLDRALNWVSFHLRVLDRQGSELKRLEKKVKQRAPSEVPSPHPRGHAKEVDAQQPTDSSHGAYQQHGHERVGMASESHKPQRRAAKERGPP